MGGIITMPNPRAPLKHRLDDPFITVGFERRDARTLPNTCPVLMPILSPIPKSRDPRMSNQTASSDAAATPASFTAYPGSTNPSGSHARSRLILFAATHALTAACEMRTRGTIT